MAIKSISYEICSPPASHHGRAIKEMSTPPNASIADLIQFILLFSHLDFLFLSQTEAVITYEDAAAAWTQTVGFPWLNEMHIVNRKHLIMLHLLCTYEVYDASFSHKQSDTVGFVLPQRRRLTRQLLGDDTLWSKQIKQIYIYFFKKAFEHFLIMNRTYLMVIHL